MATCLLDRIRAALKRSSSTTLQLAAALAEARQADAEAAPPSSGRWRGALPATSIGPTSAPRPRPPGRGGAPARRRSRGRRRSGAAGDLAELHPRPAFDLVALLGRVTLAQQAVAAVDADLPAGFGLLADPEMAVRGRIALPPDVLDGFVMGVH